MKVEITFHLKNFDLHDWSDARADLPGALHDFFKNYSPRATVEQVDMVYSHA